MFVRSLLVIYNYSSVQGIKNIICLKYTEIFWTQSNKTIPDATAIRFRANLCNYVQARRIRDVRLRGSTTHLILLIIKDEDRNFHRWIFNKTVSISHSFPARVAPAHAYSSRASVQMNFSQLVLAYWFTSCIYLFFGVFFLLRLLLLPVLDNNTVDWNNNFELLSMEHLATELLNVHVFFYNEHWDCGIFSSLDFFIWFWNSHLIMYVLISNIHLIYGSIHYFFKFWLKFFDIKCKFYFMKINHVSFLCMKIIEKLDITLYVK